MSEENGMLRAVKLRKIRKCGHWKRRGDSIVLATIERRDRGQRKTRQTPDGMDGQHQNMGRWSGAGS